MRSEQLVQIVWDGWMVALPPPPCNIVSVSITDLMELVQLYLLKYIISHLPPSLQPLQARPALSQLSYDMAGL